MSFLEPLLIEKLKTKAESLNVQSIEALSEHAKKPSEYASEDYLDTLIEAKQGESLDRLAEEIIAAGGRNIKMYPPLDTIAAEVPFDTLVPFKMSPKVHGIYDGVGRIKHCLNRSVPMIIEHDKIKLPDELPGGDGPPDGRGVKVCVIDTGIDPEHPDLKTVIKEIKDFTNDEDGFDYDGHGTHVASTIAGSGAASHGERRGVAPGVDLYIAKVFDRRCQTTRRAIIDAMLWAAEQGVQVVNLSLGDSSTARDGTCPLCRTVDYVADQGVFVACSAGNEAQSPDGVTFGTGTITCPANAHHAFTVGAVSKEREIAEFSSRGPTADGREKPDTAAPGVDIRAAQPGGKYQAMSGTSMASPHAAGAAALLHQLYQTFTQKRGLPDILKPEDMKSALKAGAQDLGLDGNTQGAGLINVPASFNWLEWHKLGARVSTRIKTTRVKQMSEFFIAAFILLVLGIFLYVNPAGYRIEQTIIAKGKSLYHRVAGDRPADLRDQPATQASRTETAGEKALSTEQSAPAVTAESQMDRNTATEPGLPFDEQGKFYATDREIRRLVEYVDTHPDSLEPFVDLVMLLNARGETEDAVVILNNALDTRPGHTGLLYHLGLIHFQQNRLEEAQSYLESVLENNPAHGSAEYLLGTIRDKLNSPGEPASPSGQPLPVIDSAELSRIETRLAAFWEDHIREHVQNLPATVKVAGGAFERWELKRPDQKVHTILKLLVYVSLVIYVLVLWITRLGEKASSIEQTRAGRSRISMASVTRQAFHASLGLSVIYLILGAATLVFTALRMNQYLGPYLRNPQSFMELLRADKIFLLILGMLIITKLFNRKKPSPG